MLANKQKEKVLTLRNPQPSQHPPPNQRPHNPTHNRHRRHSILIPAQILRRRYRQRQRQAATSKRQTPLGRDAQRETQTRVCVQRAYRQHNVRHYDRREVLRQLATVLKHRQRQADDAGVERGGEEIARPGEGGGRAGRGVFPELEVLEAGFEFLEDGEEGLAVEEAEHPEAEDGEESGDDDGMEDLLPSEWEGEGGKVHEYGEGELEGHGVGNSVVHWQADEKEENEVDCGVEVCLDHCRPKACPGRSRRRLMWKRRWAGAAIRRRITGMISDR